VRTTWCLFFWSLTAAAYPEIGDRVEFEGSELSRDGSYVLIEERRRVTGFDRQENAWLVEVAESGPVHRRVHNEKHGGLFERRHYEEVISLCDDRGGRVETITVPAGKFLTCYLVSADKPDLVAEAWFGTVPFGVVRKVETDFKEGRKKTLEMSDWISGEPEFLRSFILRQPRAGRLFSP
jgi:hypothetical protein